MPYCNLFVSIVALFSVVLAVNESICAISTGAVKCLTGKTGVCALGKVDAQNDATRFGEGVSCHAAPDTFSLTEAEFQGGWRYHSSKAHSQQSL